MTDTPAWMAQIAEARAAEDALKPINREALFDALVAEGITAVAVEFDGGSDEGQIERIAFYRDEDELPEPCSAVEFREPAASPQGTASLELTVPEAVEHIAYDLLEQTYGAWRDGEGGYGDFRFEVGPRTIALSVNARFVASENHQYSF